MTLDNLAHLVDHTLLKPEATKAEVTALVTEAAALGTYSVCVSPSQLPVSVPDGLKVAAVCGFPSGAHRIEVKVLEAELACADGADEIDMVINLSRVKDGDFAYVEDEIRAVREVVVAPKVLKVIIESALLTEAEIVAVCGCAVRAGADFVKTSTGYHPAGGASVAAVRQMAAAVAGKAEVKASGGIRDGAFARELVAAGATRLGLSGTRGVVDSY